MKDILEAIEKCKKKSVKKKIDARIREFKELREKDDNAWFKEACFCILTANFNAERTMVIQKKLGNKVLHMNRTALATELRELGYRFPNIRAKHITEAQQHKGNIKQEILLISDASERRNWVIQNIKGLGIKEASHFLRNVGYDTYAIVDFHIVDILERYGLISRQKSMTTKIYLDIEKTLGNIAADSRLTQAELDLYLWYMETGKVLK